MWWIAVLLILIILMSRFITGKYHLEKQDERCFEDLGLHKI